MPALSPLTDAAAPEAARGLFRAIQAKFGMVPNIFRTMGHAPDVLKATLDWDAAILHDLDPKLRELAYLKTANLLGCQLLAAANFQDRILLGLGIPLEDGGPLPPVEVRFDPEAPRPPVPGCRSSAPTASRWPSGTWRAKAWVICSSPAA